MSDSISKYKNSDSFFYYKTNSLEEQAKADLIRICLQRKRKMFYNRSEGCDIDDKENYPNTLSLQVDIRYSIASAIARYNQFVSDGEGNSIDRRIAVSQNSISFLRKDLDTLCVSILYYLYSTFEQQNQNLEI